MPPEVFSTPYTNPVGGSPENVRANLREAVRLLKEAGYEVRDRRLVELATGRPISLPAYVPVETYPVRIVDGVVRVDLP